MDITMQIFSEPTCICRLLFSHYSYFTSANCFICCLTLNFRHGFILINLMNNAALTKKLGIGWSYTMACMKDAIVHYYIQLLGPNNSLSKILWWRKIHQSSWNDIDVPANHSKMCVYHCQAQVDNQTCHLCMNTAVQSHTVHAGEGPTWMDW